MKNITIVMVTYNGFEDTINCLSTLDEGGYHFDLIVVDNNSASANKHLMYLFQQTCEHHFPMGSLKVIYLKKRVGVFHALHIGALQVETKYMAYIHQDMTFPNQTWLEDHMKEYQDGHMLMINQYYSGREVPKRSFVCGFLLYSFIMTTKTYLECPVDWRYNLYMGDLEHQLRFVQRYGKDKWALSEATPAEHRGGVIVRERGKPTANKIHLEDLNLFKSRYGAIPQEQMINYAHEMFIAKIPVLEIPPIDGN